MTKIHGLRSKKKKENILIEILGQIDCGKKEIGDLVAKKLGATYLSFPLLFNLDSPTASILRNALIHSPRVLEANPQWWAHIYMAHLQEVKDKINAALEHGPVVVTNYVMAFRVWARAASFDIDTCYIGFTAGLPQPTCAFTIIGDKLESYRNLDVDFSPSFILSVNRGMLFVSDKKVLKKVYGLTKGQTKATSFNKCADDICYSLHKKYKLNVLEHIKFTPGSFTNRTSNG